MKLFPLIPRAVAGVAATILAGCHSLPPLHYYTLDAIAPAGATAPPAFAMPVRLRHLSVPHDVDHLGLTHHVGGSQLSISDTDQWSAPIASLIQGALTHDLGARLGFDRVVAADALPAATGASVASLDVDFVSLSADDSCAIDAQVSWMLSVPGASPRHGSVHLAAPASSCPGGLPAALSTALGDFADQLATQFRTP